MNKTGIFAFIGEAQENFFMAMSALAAHKLRSILTLLGVLVGVFSIIVVMTAMRVMQNFINSQLSSLGGQTFMIRKWPALYFGGSSADFEKYWRRKTITMAQGDRLTTKVHLPQSVGMECSFWAGEIQTRYKRRAPAVRLNGETPGSFPARNWNLAEGRLLFDSDVENNRDVCVLGASLATNIFPNSSAVGERVKIDGINYTIVGVLEKKRRGLGRRPG